MYRGTEPTAGLAPTLPAGLAVSETRIERLLALLAQLDYQEQSTLLDECFTRAQKEKQLADLRQAVAQLQADHPLQDGTHSR